MAIAKNGTTTRRFGAAAGGNVYAVFCPDAALGEKRGGAAMGVEKKPGGGLGKPYLYTSLLRDEPDMKNDWPGAKLVWSGPESSFRYVAEAKPGKVESFAAVVLTEAAMKDRCPVISVPDEPIIA